MPEAWNPDQYLRFRAEREQPFRDLLALVRKKPAMRVCDLGCGTGSVLRELEDTKGSAAQTNVAAAKSSGAGKGILFALLVLLVAAGTAAVVYFALPYFT